LQVLPFETHKCEPPSTKVTTDKAELMELFETMYRMRRMEIASDMLYKAKLIRGFCHLYDGQEAVITGLTRGSNFKDSIITSYRDHALHLVRGGTVREVIGELLGRSTGASRGLGGSMHMYNKKNNFYGGCGIVGAQVLTALQTPRVFLL
jgi:pyruvate dehydrogenase E1 component alpha subunit